MRTRAALAIRTALPRALRCGWTEPASSRRDRVALPFAAGGFIAEGRAADADAAADKGSQAIFRGARFFLGAATACEAFALLAGLLAGAAALTSAGSPFG
jgi:hypothetical protein